MKKIIRLTESELVSLVKRTIMEDNQSKNVEEIIRNYDGSVGFIKSLKDYLLRNKQLSQSQIETAMNILNIKNDNGETQNDIILKKLVNYNGCHSQLNTIKEKYIKNKFLSGGDYLIISDYLKEDEKFRKNPNNLIKNLGSQTYLEMVRGPKKIIYDGILRGLTKNYKISSPSNPWYKKNIEDLEEVEKIFGDKTNKKINFIDEKKSLTLSEKINSLILRCKNKDYIGILEIENDDDQMEKWSILNKIDTNWSNWREMIDYRETNEPGTLINGTEYEKICDYFKQKPCEEILSPVDLKELKSYCELISFDLKTLSLAEYDLLEIFTDETKLKLNKIKTSIQKTTDIGNYTENDFKIYSKSRDFNIIEDFSEPGNLVDTNLGIDLIIEYNNEIYAVQIKSSKAGAENYPFVTKLGVKYLVIFPQGKRFGYFSNDNPKEVKDFDTDFLNHKY
jgi:hypothetical protein